MAAKIQDLVVKLKADAGEFKATLQEAGGQAQQFSDGMKRSMTDVNTFAKSAGVAIGGIAIAVGGAVAALGTMVAQQSQAAAEMSRVAQSLDVNAQKFQKLSYAAEQYGLTQEDMADILKDTSERITELVTVGGGAALDFFEQMNISVEEFKGLSPDETFIKMMEALSQLDNQQERNLYLLQIMGDKGQRLSEVAEDGAASFLALAESLDQAGGVMNEHMLAEATELDKVLKDLSGTTARQLSAFMVELTPLVRDVAGWFKEWSAEVVLIADTMRRSPLTEGGLALAIEEDTNAIKDLKAELVDLAAGPKYGMNSFMDLLTGTDRQTRTKEVEEELAELEARLKENSEKFERLRFGNAVSFGETPADVVAPDTSFSSQGGGSSVGTGFVKPGAKEDKPKAPTFGGFTEDQIEAGLESMRRGFLEQDALEWEHHLDRIELLEAAYEAQIISEDELRSRSLESFNQYQDRLTDATEKGAKDRAAIQERLDKQVLGAQLNVAQQSLALIEQSAKEGSGLQKAAFMLGKAVAIGMTWINTEAAAIAALAPPPIGLGPVAGLPYSQTIRALGYTSMGLMAGQAIAGIAHGGLGYVPEESTYLLQRGESVLSPQQNVAVTAAAEKINSGGVAGGPVTVNLIEDRSRAGQVEQRQGANGQMEIDAFVADIRGGGERSQVLEQTYPALRRGGR